jgi:hypothetical protein
VGSIRDRAAGEGWDGLEGSMADDRVKFSHAHSTTDHKGGVSVTKIEHAPTGFKAFAYQCTLNEDLDGAPKAYGVNNNHPVDAAHNPDTALQQGIAMLESGLCNAVTHVHNCESGSHDFAWVGIFAATQAFATAHNFSIDRRAFLEARRRLLPDGNTAPLAAGEPGLFPAIQPQGSAAPGYFVSTTAITTDPTLNDWDQAKYVNATAIPYAVWAGWWHGLGVAKGDFGLAFRHKTGDAYGFVFGDSGKGKVGEVSRKLFETLSPDRKNEEYYNFIVFPGSGAGVANKLTSDQVIQDRVKALTKKFDDIPIGDTLYEFFALGANRARLRAFLTGKYVKKDEPGYSEGDPLWWNAWRALKAYGMEGGTDTNIAIDGHNIAS